MKTVALILAVLVVLAVAGVWMAQKYIVYDDGGYHLELPFFQKEGPAQEPEDGMADLLSQAGLPEGEERLALLVEELDPDLDCSQGIWDPEA